MKPYLVIISLLSLLIPPQTQAAAWQNNSEIIPDTFLDKYIELPYLSISVSRGHDWLAGNPNRLFHAMNDGSIDLTPRLKDYGFTSIRRVATDGSSWLIIGDAEVWQTRPDLAFIYDGKYLKNVSHVIRDLPRDEWISQITGKNGLWYFITDKGIYAWHNALTQPAKISLPDSFKEPRIGNPKMHSVKHGWIVEFTQKHGPLSIAHARDITDRRFFHFDGQNFQELSSLFGNNMSGDSIIGTNGGNILIMGAVYDMLSYNYRAYLSDGKRVTEVTPALNALLPQQIKPTSQIFLNQTTVIWTGKSWLLHNNKRNLATWEQSSPARLLPDTSDIILAAGYGKKGNALLAGYKKNEANTNPRLLLYSE
ncbi:hypothetical protein GF391_02730 [Candidatus Uhrbacteria bacterium]|nr:hypothetical protein [Candidatus Uhrbacteria bacterium]